MTKKEEVQNVKNKPVPYKYGEKIDPANREKAYIVCPECHDISYCPSQEDAGFMCPKGHTWHLREKDGERFMAKGSGERMGKKLFK